MTTTTLPITPAGSAPGAGSGSGDAVSPLERSQLRLVIAGSVDDGKSTLVGRLLHDTKSILADQFDAVEAASKRRGADEIDLALLTDGLRAEREQGITIDVAYRYFSTPARSFILADTPGHTQYTRNTVTGASTADAAVILVDARNGALVQTRRHAAVMALLRVPHVVFAVNKMDAVDWSKERFDEIAADLRSLADTLHLRGVQVVPVSALTGANVASREGAPDWYDGPALLELVEGIDAVDEAATRDFRMPVQLVIRPRTAEHPDYRGLAGRVASGSLAVGDTVVAQPSGLTSVVTGIDSPAGPLSRALAGDSVTVLLRDELDVGRGQVLALAGAEPAVRSELEGVVTWLDERPGRVGARNLLVKVGTHVVRAILTAAPQRWDVDALAWVDCDEPLALNDIARVTLRLAEPVAADDYADDRATGAFLLIDQPTGATVAAGMVGDPLA